MLGMCYGSGRKKERNCFESLAVPPASSACVVDESETPSLPSKNYAPPVSVFQPPAWTGATVAVSATADSIPIPTTGDVLESSEQQPGSPAGPASASDTAQASSLPTTTTTTTSTIGLVYRWISGPLSCVRPRDGKMADDRKSPSGATAERVLSTKDVSSPTSCKLDTIAEDKPAHSMAADATGVTSIDIGAMPSASAAQRQRNGSCFTMDFQSAIDRESVIQDDELRTCLSRPRGASSSRGGLFPYDDDDLDDVYVKQEHGGGGASSGYSTPLSDTLAFALNNFEESRMSFNDKQERDLESPVETWDRRGQLRDLAELLVDVSKTCMNEEPSAEYLVFNDNSLRVWKKEFGVNRLLIRSEFFVPVCPRDYCQYASEMANRKKWDKNIEEVRRVEGLGDRVDICYTGTKRIATVYPRDLVSLRVVRCLKPQRALSARVAYTSCSCSVLHPMEREKKGRVRADMRIASYVALPVDVGGESWSCVRVFNEGNPRGWIPGPVVRLFASKVIPSTVECIASAVMREHSVDWRQRGYTSALSYIHDHLTMSAAAASLRGQVRPSHVLGALELPSPRSSPTAAAVFTPDPPNDRQQLPAAAAAALHTPSGGGGVSQVVVGSTTSREEDGDAAEGGEPVHARQARENEGRGYEVGSSRKEADSYADAEGRRHSNGETKATMGAEEEEEEMQTGREE
eukprot:GHVU01109107.1.p1 GENE.GHVU01109107.1~~GHVU01109107.1.p1  ORF type:complete len:689 (+),score=139.93 GHVU01109107.1:262-2328(+)